MVLKIENLMIHNESGSSETIDPAEIYLRSANIKKAIEMHLWNHGAFTDAKTRVFLANLRDVMDALERRTKADASGSSKVDSSLTSPTRLDAA